MKSSKSKGFKSKGTAIKKIAIMLGLPINTVKSYCRRHSQNENASTYENGFCKNCGTPVKQLPNRKEKKFCSDKCRIDWWLKHVAEHKTKTQQEVKCRLCGKPLLHTLLTSANTARAIVSMQLAGRGVTNESRFKSKADLV